MYYKMIRILNRKVWKKNTGGNRDKGSRKLMMTYRCVYLHIHRIWDIRLLRIPIHNKIPTRLCEVEFRSTPGKFLCGQFRVLRKYLTDFKNNVTRIYFTSRNYFEEMRVVVKIKYFIFEQYETRLAFLWCFQHLPEFSFNERSEKLNNCIFYLYYKINKRTYIPKNYKNKVDHYLVNKHRFRVTKRYKSKIANF